MNFHIGQRVVCINDKFPYGYASDAVPFMPTRGLVYTVRGICRWQFGDGLRTAIYLEELKNPEINWRKPIQRAEHPFFIGRFRPVKETNISVFTAMLVPSPKEKVLT